MQWSSLLGMFGGGKGKNESTVMPSTSSVSAGDIGGGKIVFGNETSIATLALVAVVGFGAAYILLRKRG